MRCDKLLGSCHLHWCPSSYSTCPLWQPVHTLPNPPSYLAWLPSSRAVVACLSLPTNPCSEKMAAPHWALVNSSTDASRTNIWSRRPRASSRSRSISTVCERAERGRAVSVCDDENTSSSQVGDRKCSHAIIVDYIIQYYWFLNWFPENCWTNTRLFHFDQKVKTYLQFVNSTQTHWCINVCVNGWCYISAVHRPNSVWTHTSDLELFSFIDY